MEQSQAMKPKTSRERPPNGRSRKRPKAAATPGEQPALTARLLKVRKLFTTHDLVRICGVSRQALSTWRDVPAKHALAIAEASEGKLTKEFLAPNFYKRPA